MSQPSFLMPVVQADLLPPKFAEHVDTFFKALDTLSEHHALIGFRADFYATEEESDHFVADAAMRLYTQNLSGKIHEIEATELGSGELEIFKNLLLGFHLSGSDVPRSAAYDELLPWSEDRFRSRLWGNYHSLHFLRDFTLVTREFLPLYVQNNSELLEGAKADRDDRKVCCTLVLPTPGTAHETIEQVTRHPRITRQAKSLYHHLTSGFFIEEEEGYHTELELDDIEVIEI